MNRIRQEWYRLNNMSTEHMDARQLAIHVGMKSGLVLALNLLAGEEIHSDKGYEVSTHEKYEEFAAKRNYPLDDK